MRHRILSASLCAGVMRRGAFLSRSFEVSLATTKGRAAPPGEGRRFRSACTAVWLVAVLVACPATPARAVETIWQGPPNIAADWFASANWDTRIPQAQDNAYIRDDLIARIEGGSAVAGRLTIGLATNGYMVQTGGSLVISNLLTMSSSATEFSTFDLDGGVLDTPASYIGGYGEARFRHTNGTHTTGPLNLGGYNGTQTGSPNLGIYEMSGDAHLVATSLRVGFHGRGMMTMDGGVAEIQGPLRVGELQATTESRLSILDGEIDAESIVVGNNGWGGISQQGGGVTSQTDLVLGGVSGCTCTPIASYSLSGGTLSVANIEYVGRNGANASLFQLAGNHEVGQLVVGESGSDASFIIEGGTFAANDVTVKGPLGRFIVFGGEGEIHVDESFVMTNFSSIEEKPRLELHIDEMGLAPIRVGGRATLSGTLDVRFSPYTVPIPGGVYEFLTAEGGIEGTLALTGSYAHQFRLEIDGNSARVVALPEPATLCLAATAIGCTLGMGACRRRANRRMSRRPPDEKSPRAVLT